MLTLNTLRTRFGIVLSIVIVLALLAFILSLGPEMGLFGNDQNPVVAEVNDEEIKYSDYARENQNVQNAFAFITQGQEKQYIQYFLDMQYDPSEELVAALKANGTWQNLAFDNYITPAMEDIGIVVTDEEADAMLKGTINTSAYLRLYTLPNYQSIMALLQFYASGQVSADLRAKAEAGWPVVKGIAADNRLIEKYHGLLKAGTYVNKLEVEQGVKNANVLVDGRYFTVPLNSVPDSLVKVSESEIKAYYNKTKELYRKLPTRKISYVAFDIEPTAEDQQTIQAKAEQIAESLKGVEDALDIQTIIAKNMGAVDNLYLPASRMTDEEAVVFDGEVYGPVLDDNEWEVAKAVKLIEAPDSIGISLIFAESKVADKIVADAQNGGDFATLVEKYGLSAQNFISDVVAFSDLRDLGVDAIFAERLASAKVGDVLKNDNPQYSQIVKVDRVDSKSEHALIGRVKLMEEASAETVQSISTRARKFASEARGSVSKFNKAVSAFNLPSRSATIAENDYIVMNNNMPIYDRTHQIVTWASKASVGSVSDVFDVGDCYVVAVVTGIDNSKYEPVSEHAIAIEGRLKDMKRADYLKKQYTGLSIDEAAAKAGVEKIESYSGLRFADTSVGSLVMVPNVAGIIATTEKGTTTSVVADVAMLQTVAVVFVNDDVKQPETLQTAEAEQLRQQTTIDEWVMNPRQYISFVNRVLMKMNHVDNRNKFF